MAATWAVALLALAFLAPVTAGGGASGPAAWFLDDQPLYNEDFSFGSPHGIACPAALLDVLFDSTGSVAPGLTDPHAGRPAVGWTHRILSGQSCPRGAAAWEEPGEVRVEVAAEDVGPATAVLAQAVGQRPHLSLWRDPTHVTVHLVEVAGAPVTFWALYASHEVDVLRVTEPRTVAPGPAVDLVLPFPPGEQGGMTQFMLAFTSEGGTTFMVTGVEVQGARQGVRLTF